MFNKNKHCKDGLTFYCRDCISEYGKKYRETPRGIYSNIVGRSNYNNKRGSKSYKPVKISYKEFLKWYEETPHICHYCGINEDNLKPLQDLFDERVTRLEIDCKDNSMGYTKDNIVLACHLCNSIKIHLFSEEEMLYIGQNFIKPKWSVLND